jgi:hypothetical protein
MLFESALEAKYEIFRDIFGYEELNSNQLLG